MTKTIQQRLQSRIAKRRNFIRFAEEERTILEQSRLEIRKFADAIGIDADVTELSHAIHNANTVIRDVAEDQKLDKQIGRIILGLSQQRRHFGLSDL